MSLRRRDLLRLACALCALTALAAPHLRAAGEQAEDPPPREATLEIGGRKVPRELVKHVLLHTTLGDLRIALRPELAPAQCRRFLDYCRAGVYDGRIINRVERQVKMELGYADRRMLKEELKTEKLKPELDILFEPVEEDASEERLTRGAVYFASPRRDTPFLGIWLGRQDQAPKGQGPFAQLYAGHDTLDRHDKIKVTDTHYPRAQLRILWAKVLDPDDQVERSPAFEQLVEERFRDMAEPRFLQERNVREARRSAPMLAPAAGQDAVAMLGAVLALLGLSVYGLQRHLTPRGVQVLGMVALAVGGFALMVRMTPLAPDRPWISVAIFAGAAIAYAILMGMDAPPGEEPAREVFGAAPTASPASSEKDAPAGE